MAGRPLQPIPEPSSPGWGERHPHHADAVELSIGVELPDGVANRFTVTNPVGHSVTDAIGVALRLGNEFSHGPADARAHHVCVRRSDLQPDADPLI